MPKFNGCTMYILEQGAGHVVHLVRVGQFGANLLEEVDGPCEGCQLTFYRVARVLEALLQNLQRKQHKLL